MSASTINRRRGRQEKPLDPNGGAACGFAQRLREARKAAGNPSYRSMGREVHFSPSVLSQAASGRNVPSWPVVQAYVQACNQSNLDWWRSTWTLASAQTKTGLRTTRLTPRKLADRKPVPAASPSRFRPDAAAALLLAELDRIRAVRGLSLRAVALRSKELQAREAQQGMDIGALSRTTISDVLAGRRDFDERFIELFLTAVDATLTEQGLIGVMVGKLNRDWTNAPMADAQAPAPAVQAAPESFSFFSPDLPAPLADPPPSDFPAAPAPDRRSVAAGWIPDTPGSGAEGSTTLQEGAPALHSRCSDGSGIYRSHSAPPRLAVTRTEPVHPEQAPRPTRAQAPQVRCHRAPKRLHGRVLPDQLRKRVHRHLMVSDILHILASLALPVLAKGVWDMTTALLATATSQGLITTGATLLVADLLGWSVLFGRPMKTSPTPLWRRYAYRARHTRAVVPPAAAGPSQPRACRTVGSPVRRHKRSWSKPDALVTVAVLHAAVPAVVLSLKLLLLLSAITGTTPPGSQENLPAN